LERGLEELASALILSALHPKAAVTKRPQQHRASVKRQKTLLAVSKSPKTSEYQKGLSMQLTVVGDRFLMVANVRVWSKYSNA
jgi:hypothetical protein